MEKSFIKFIRSFFPINALSLFMAAVMAMVVRLILRIFYSRVDLCILNFYGGDSQKIFISIFNVEGGKNWQLTTQFCF